MTSPMRSPIGGGVRLSVIASAPGEQGAKPADIALDPSAAANGTLASTRGIDDTPSTRVEDLRKAGNGIDAALTDVAAGRPVTTPTARPYGCSVNHAS